VATFAVVVVIAIAIFFRIGMRSWFRWDDWDFLANRTAGDLHGLLVPHGDHWSAVPILTYRVLWQFFGLEFAAYLFTAIALHVVSAVLLWVVIRRAGAGPWIATAAASLFALFGVGYENTAFLFGLNFGGWPVVFGLLYLILADHDGPFDRRDWLGLFAGLGAIASSGVGVAMVVAVGVATLMRRGRRAAVAHVLPLAALYVGWYLAFANKEATGSTVSDVVRFIVDAGSGIFLELGQSYVAAIALVVVLIVGLELAWQPLKREELRVRASLPFGLLIGALAFLAITGYNRSGLPGTARLSHYMDAAAVMVLPALAVAAQTIARRVPKLALVVPLVFLVGIPGNLAALEDGVDAQEAFAEHQERLMLTVPRTSLAANTQRDLVPEPIFSSPASIGWLRTGLASGRLPTPPKHPPVTLDGEIELRLSLQQTNGLADWAPCRTLHVPVVQEVVTGQHISLGRGFVTISLLRGDRWTKAVNFGQPFADRYFARLGETLTAVRGPLVLRIGPVPNRDNWVCGLSS